ncbi:MAG: hypothetical protein DRI57_00075 [Deltaproteobacteria bacterium]|nr:MAG: hypothetical protein DRI57_00075 [Deltaproteobacteria bacterium]
MALQLYFHSLDYGFPENKALDSLHDSNADDLASRFLPPVIKQSSFVLIVTICCFFWMASGDTTPGEALETVKHPVRFWLALAGGLVLLGSVAAYVCDNLGFDRYEEEKSRLPFRIRGVEWLGISTLLDPMVASILTALFPVLAGGAEKTAQTQPVFFVLCLGFILLLIVLKVMSLRHSKLQELKIFCFSHLRSKRTSGESVNPDDFSSVAPLRNLENILEKMEQEDSAFELTEIYRFREAETPKNDLDKHLQYQLWLFNSNHLELRTSIAVWVMKHGKRIYDSKQLFERLLFHEHMRYFAADEFRGRILIFFPDKLRYDEALLTQMAEAVTGEPLGEDDQIFYFLNIQNHKELPGHLQKFIRENCLMIFENRDNFTSTQHKVMFECLGV